MTANLLSRLQGLTAPDREVDALICVALQYGGPNSEGATNVRTDSEWDEEDVIFEVGSEACCNRTPELTASLDAAVTLCERVLPGWKKQFFESFEGLWIARVTSPRRETYSTDYMRDIPPGGSPNGAIALLIAILTALEARDGTE